MKQITVLEKYPVFTLEVTKEETSYQSVDEILEHLKEKIIAHPIATYIGVFDHYTHTMSLAELPTLRLKFDDEPSVKTG